MKTTKTNGLTVMVVEAFKGSERIERTCLRSCMNETMKALRADGFIVTNAWKL
jgi:hypothetical protein